MKFNAKKLIKINNYRKIVWYIWYYKKDEKVMYGI